MLTAYLCALLMFGLCMKAKTSSFHTAAGAVFLGTSTRLFLTHILQQVLRTLGRYPENTDLLQFLMMTAPCSVLLAVVGHLAITKFAPFPRVFSLAEKAAPDGIEGKPAVQYGVISRLFSVMVLVIAFSDEAYKGPPRPSWVDTSAALTLPLILFALVLWASSHGARPIARGFLVTTVDLLDLVMLPILTHVVMAHTGGVHSAYRALHIPVVVTNSLKTNGRGLFSACVSLGSITILGFQAWSQTGSWTSDSNFTIGLVYVLTYYVTNRFAANEATLKKQLVEKATTDDLTELYNHGFVDSYLGQVLSSSKGRTYLLMIDLDNFKMLNDSLGHVNGDLLLKDIADNLKSTVRSGDIVARYGGDEFIVIPDQVTSKEQVWALGERLRRSVERACDLFVAEHGLQRMSSALTASVGIAYTGDSIRDREELVRAADEALYSAKSQGKNRAVMAG